MISIAIFGGEGEGDFQKNCRLLKVITFERTKKAEEGVPRIEITFDVDVNNNVCSMNAHFSRNFSFEVYEAKYFWKMVPVSL